jgi:ech hydrogenase subunit B
MIMTNILTAAAILVGTLILGGLLSGLDRKITAHMQGRKGPPIVQPFYDVIKLLGKQRFAVNKMQDVYAAGFFVFMAAADIMFFMGSDLLILVFVMAFGSVSLVMGAMSVRSPFSRIGGQREIIQLMVAEPVILLTAVGVYLTTGSFLVSKAAAQTVPLMASMPLAFVALLVVMTVKLRKSPFDFSTSHHGHQELVKGLTMEYSGLQLAAIEAGEWLEMVTLLGIAGLFWAVPLWAGVIVALVAYLLEITVDNISARTTWGWMLKVVGILGFGLSTVNLICLYLK